MTMHTKGLALTFFAVLLISPDSLLVRLIGMDVWSTAFWRGSTLAIGLLVLLVVMYGRNTAAAFVAIGWSGVAIAAVSVGCNFLFLAGIKHTSIANALVLLASMPLHAAVLSWVFLGEKMAARTWIAMIAAAGGIAIIFADGLGRGNAFGDLMALLAAIFLAAQLTMVRGRASIDMIPAGMLGAVAIAMVAVIVGGAPEMPDGNQALWIFVTGFLILTPATALLTFGPRYISSPEVGLLVLLETVLGPMWAYFVIHESPSLLAVVGGSLVIITLAVYFLTEYREQNRKARAAMA